MGFALVNDLDIGEVLAEPHNLPLISEMQWCVSVAMLSPSDACAA